ncbi:MAG: signal peptidase I [Chitinophagales bacterium]
MLSVLLFYFIYYILHVSLWGIFKKAGKNPIHTLIPFLQDKTWLEILGKNPNKAFWGLIPYVNFIFSLTWITDTLTCFGKTKFWQVLAVTFFGYIYFPIIGFDKTTKYIGPIYKDGNKPKRSTLREWSDAIVFAVVAATFVRMFAIEAYKIPTTSMEGSLLAGDFLFVSKMSYGARVPMTPIAFPFAHHTMPFNLGKAYSKIIQLGYHRLPGFTTIKRGDVVVFNYPGDAYDFPDRPIDKRENYVKRCVAIAGETLEVKDRYLYVNGEKQPQYKNKQYDYTVITNENKISPEIFKDLEINWYNDFFTRPYADGMGRPVAPLDNLYADFLNYINTSPELEILLTDTQYDALKKMPNVTSIKPTDMSKYIDLNSVFPHNINYFQWTTDDFGPLTVPKKGMTIPLDTTNLVLYASTIKDYELQDISMNGSQVLINGQPATSYTFKQDYYFMMGDNRHNSLDSRYWGFVPEDHVVGKPLFVFFSMNNFESFPERIKFNRIFRSVKALCE